MYLLSTVVVTNVLTIFDSWCQLTYFFNFVINDYYDQVYYQ